MKRYYFEFGVALILLAVLAIMAALTWNDDEIKQYIDPENNVFCYYNSGGVACFTYSDEGTHLELKP